MIEEVQQPKTEHQTRHVRYFFQQFIYILLSSILSYNVLVIISNFSTFESPDALLRSIGDEFLTLKFRKPSDQCKEEFQKGVEKHNSDLKFMFISNTLFNVRKNSLTCLKVMEIFWRGSDRDRGLFSISPKSSY